MRNVRCFEQRNASFGDDKGSKRGVLSFKARNRNGSYEVSATGERSFTYRCKILQLQVKSLSPIAERQKGCSLFRESAVQTPRKEAPFSPITLCKRQEGMAYTRETKECLSF